MTENHVAIIGGGFTGTLLAINLLRHDGPSVTLIERRQHLARGVAYSTVHPEHLLNVRAGNMSALPDDPDHFVRWLGREGIGGPAGFVPRRSYGDYLGALLEETRLRAPERLRLVQGDAVDVVATGSRAEVRLADGAGVPADIVALAPGNLPPLPLPGLDPASLPDGCYIDDPWKEAVGDGLGADDTVLVLGTGLTMVDVALLLEANGFAGRMLALSRRGLMPRAHADVPAYVPRDERPHPTALAMLQATRARAREVGWRAAVDELRPFTQGLWQAMDEAEARRFLCHVRPWWDVHRHRIAPAVAGQLERMREAGRLEVLAGRLLRAEAAPGGARVTYLPRGDDAERRLVARRIVNATGPQGGLDRSPEPLLRALRGRGLLRADPLAIGIDVDRESRAIGADGTASDRLLVLGPPTRGAFWEIVAVPDIRVQAWSVARRLSHAQWVEGEGL